VDEGRNSPPLVLAGRRDAQDPPLRWNGARSRPLSLISTVARNRHGGGTDGARHKADADVDREPAQRERAHRVAMR
jgi:hypothetical protein